MIPFGASTLEHEGREFEEYTSGGFPVRVLKADKAETVSFKSEEMGATDITTLGPVFIDGVPFVERQIEGNWFPAWYNRADARQMAKRLDARFEDV